MLIFYAALRAIPHDLYEAAEVDGAGEFRKVVEHQAPGAAAARCCIATIFSIIGSFQLFNEPKVLTDLAPAVIGTSYTPNIYAY